MDRRVAVATSGGRDSTALLHATARAGRVFGFQVWALHVHHGLMPQAADWWRHVRRQCARWRRAGLPVHFEGRRLRGAPAAGDSVEAWARRERYAALGDMARSLGIDMVLLAHHRRDQAETVLLQALRSAGPAGLAAMPRAVERHGVWWCRPWLDHPSEAVDAYARRHRLRFVEDPSNRDPRFSRGRLRHLAWPVLTETFPQLEVALSGVARRMQEADAALAELACLDAKNAVMEEGGRLRIAVWQALTLARRGLLLRHWARSWSPVGMPDSLVGRLQRELPRARTGHRWPAPGGQLHLERGGMLSFVPSVSGSPSPGR